MDEYGIILKNSENNVLISNEAESMHYLGSSTEADHEYLPRQLHAGLGVAYGHEVGYGGIFIYSFPDLVKTSAPILAFIAPAHNTTAYTWLDHYMEGTTLKIVVLFEKYRIDPPRVLIFSTLANSVQYGNVPTGYGIKVMNSTGAVTYDSRYSPLNILSVVPVELNSQASYYATKGFTGNYGTIASIPPDATAFSYRGAAYGSQFVSTKTKKEHQCWKCGKHDYFCVEKFLSVVKLYEWWSYFKPGIILTRGQHIIPKWVQQVKLSHYAGKKGPCRAKITGLWTALVSLLEGSFRASMVTMINFMFPIGQFPRMPRGSFHRGTNITIDRAGASALMIDSGIYTDNLITPAEPVLVFSSTIFSDSSVLVPYSTMGNISDSSDIVSLTASHSGTAVATVEGIVITPQSGYVGVTSVNLTTNTYIQASGVYPLSSAYLIEITTESQEAVAEILKPDYIGVVVEGNLTSFPIAVKSSYDWSTVTMTAEPTIDEILVGSIEITTTDGIDGVALIDVSATATGSVTLKMFADGVQVAISDIPIEYRETPYITVDASGYTYSNALGGTVAVVNEFRTSAVEDSEYVSGGTSTVRLTRRGLQHIVVKNGTARRRSPVASCIFTSELVDSPEYFGGESIVAGMTYTLSTDLFYELVGVSVNITGDKNPTLFTMTHGTINYSGDTFTIVMDDLYEGEFIIALNDPRSGTNYISSVFSCRTLVPLESGVYTTAPISVPYTNNTNLHDSYEGLKVRWADILPASLVAGEWGQVTIRPEGAADSVDPLSTGTTVFNYSAFSGCYIDYSNEYLSIWTTSSGIIGDVSSSSYTIIPLIVTVGTTTFNINLPVVATPYIGGASPWSGAANLDFPSGDPYLGKSVKVNIEINSGHVVTLSNRNECIEGVLNTTSSSWLVDSEIHDVVGDGVYRPVAWSTLGEIGTRSVMMSPSILDYVSNTMEKDILPIPSLYIVGEDGSSNAPATTPADGVLTTLDSSDYIGFESASYLYSERVLTIESSAPGLAETSRVVTRTAAFVPELVFDISTYTVYMEYFGGYWQPSGKEIIITMSEGSELPYEEVWLLSSSGFQEYTSEWESFTDSSVRSITSSTSGNGVPGVMTTSSAVPDFSGVLLVKYIDSTGETGEARKVISFKKNTGSIKTIFKNNYVFTVPTITFSKGYFLTSEGLEDISVLYSPGNSWFIPTNNLSGRVSGWGSDIQGSLWTNVSYHDLFLPVTTQTGTGRACRIYKDPFIYPKRPSPVIVSGATGYTDRAMYVYPSPLLSDYTIVEGTPVDDNTYTIEVATGGEGNSPTFSAVISTYGYATINYTLPDMSQLVTGGTDMIEYRCVRKVGGVVYTDTYYEHCIYSHYGKVVEYLTNGNTLRSSFISSVEGVDVTVTPPEYTTRPYYTTDVNGVWFDDYYGKVLVRAIPGVTGYATAKAGTLDLGVLITKS